MLSFFRKHDVQSIFQQPDPAAAVQVDYDPAAAVRFCEPDRVYVGSATDPASAELTECVRLSHADRIAADLYLASKPLAKEHGGNEERAKKALLASLGTASSGVLPDGRVVSRHSVPFAAEANPRKAFTRTSISIN